MTSMNIAEAKAHLSELVARAEAGEDVVIARKGKPAVRLIPANAQGQTEGQRRSIGLWDHLNLELDDKLFFEPDLELVDAVEASRIFPQDQ